MKQQEAERLLNETFNKEFDLGRFGSFIRELFKGKCRLNLNNKSLMPYSQFSESISSFRQIGEYSSGRKNVVVMAVQLKKTDSIEKARTMQRNFIGTWLMKGDISIAKDGALVAFYGENPEDWRFSFVKMDYKFDENGKAIKELTPAKRLSYLVGKHEPNHTCRKQFLSLLQEENNPPSFQEIENAFGVENVTKEFFDLYRQRFFELKESMDKLLESSPKIKKDFEEKQINSTEFSKKLLGQIVFLYFLQKKGWLGVKKEEDGGFGEWGTGPRNFMTRLFNKEIVKYNNFFDEILEPLFYEALAKPRDYDYFSRFECKIPFLNGGLFEPIKDYDWVNTKIEIDNDIFRKIIIDTFDKFNFTIKEDEPLEREVAVDPEMLGKVFENLLDVNDRKSKGAFYTPREIVHYMCQQSLINYLETNSDIKREDLEKFILKGDLALDYLRRVTDSRKNDVSEELMIPISVRKNDEKLDKLLKNIKICDPAVGSGAFPVGMMNEIVKARQVLQYFSMGEKKSDYDLKRETIENCLHGVDIEPSAVEITKLRFWLSLIVDENDMQNIKPLPNLDNKIMCGNSLIEEFEGVKLFNDDLLSSQIKEREEKQSSLEKYTKQKIKESQLKLERLQRLQKDYFNEDNGTKKKQFMKDIENLEWEFIEATLKEQNNEDALKKLEQYKRSKSKPFFLWKLYFSDVFQRENPGFDVVIGNPPYVTYKGKEKVDVNPKEIESLIKNYPHSAEYKINSYALFVEMGTKLLTKNAILTYIIPSTILQNEYLKNIRRYILSGYNLREIVNFENKIFEAVTDSIIVFIKNSFSKEDVTHVKRKDNLIFSSSDKILDWKQADWLKFDDAIINLKINKEEENVLDKILSNSSLLEEFLSIYVGIVANGIKKFLSDKQTSSRHKKYLQGKHIQRYELNPVNLFVDFDVKNLHSNTDERVYLKKEKLLVRKTGNLLIASYDNQQYYTDQSIYNLYSKEDNPLNIKYILSLLNSKVMNYYFNKKMITNPDVFPYIKGIHLQKLPIKKIPSVGQKPFIELVDKILNITKDEDYLKNPDKQARVKAYEKQIDKMVYELYELTPEEIKIVEGEQNASKN